MRWLGAVEDSGERVVDWRGRVSVGALLRETLRRASRQPTCILAIPGLIAAAVGIALWVTEPAPILGMGFVLFVGWWGWIAQGIAGARKPGRLSLLVGMALAVMFGALGLGQRFDLGGWPLALVILLLVPLPMAIPAAAVDGLGPSVMVRDSWNASRGSLLRAWAACGVLGAVMLTGQVALGLVLVRRGADELLATGTLCGLAGAGLGLVMTLLSIGYVRLRNQRRCSDVSAWVEVFR